MSEGVFYVNVWQGLGDHQWTDKNVTRCTRSFCDRVAKIVEGENPSIKRIGLLRVTPKGGSNDER